MTTKWIPIYGDFDCPGRMLLSADKHGITIRTRRKALGTTEWPNGAIRLCELVEEPGTPTQIPENVYQALGFLLSHSEPNEAAMNTRRTTEEYFTAYNTVTEWLASSKKESSR